MDLLWPIRIPNDVQHYCSYCSTVQPPPPNALFTHHEQVSASTPAGYIQTHSTSYSAVKENSAFLSSKKQPPPSATILGPQWLKKILLDIFHKIGPCDYKWCYLSGYKVI